MTSRSKVAVHGPRQHREQRVRHLVPRRRVGEIRLVKAAARHERENGAILARRTTVCERARARRPDHWSRGIRKQRASLDVTGWLVWFLSRFDLAFDRSETTLREVLHKDRVARRLGRGEVNARQRLVVNRLMEGFQGALTTSKFARLAKCSTDTALRDIVTLVERGVLVRNPGGGRSTSYRVATFEELEDLELRD